MGNKIQFRGFFKWNYSEENKIGIVFFNAWNQMANYGRFTTVQNDLVSVNAFITTFMWKFIQFIARIKCWTQSNKRKPASELSKWLFEYRNSGFIYQMKHSWPGLQTMANIVRWIMTCFSMAICPLSTFQRSFEIHYYFILFFSVLYVHTVILNSTRTAIHSSFTKWIIGVVLT